MPPQIQYLVALVSDAVAVVAEGEVVAEDAVGDAVEKMLTLE